jgi:hypothetical protein
MAVGENGGGTVETASTDHRDLDDASPPATERDD